MPPGSATNASARWAITALRSCIESTSISSVRPVCGTSSENSERGMTPTISAPSSIAMSATAPIRPTDAPP